jgi:hypothetical protein
MWERPLDHDPAVAASRRREGLEAPAVDGGVSNDAQHRAGFRERKLSLQHEIVALVRVEVGDAQHFPPRPVPRDETGSAGRPKG